MPSAGSDAALQFCTCDEPNWPGSGRMAIVRLVGGGVRRNILANETGEAAMHRYVFLSTILAAGMALGVGISGASACIRCG